MLHQKYLRPIYPVVVFSFDEPYREEPHCYSVEIGTLKVLEFNFVPIQLNRLNWRDYLNQSNPVAAALMAKMRFTPAERPRVKVECLRMLALLRLDPAKTHLISGFVDTYLRLSEPEEQLFKMEMNTLEEQEREDVMQIVTSWMEQGIEQGERSLILRLLARQVGSLTPEVEAQIGALSLTQLDDLGEALLDFSSFTDLQNWLSAQQGDD
jgi:hypothetical protein